MIRKYLLASIMLLAAGLASTTAEAAPRPKKVLVKPTPVVAKKTSNPLGSAVSPDFSKLPTFIKSDSLRLDNDKRYFVYTGNVEVKHGDLTMTSNTLEGYYDQDNKIQKLVAKTGVLILKGDTIRGTCELATYEAASDLLTLTENPELTQEGSVLTGDTIKVFLKENRSEATGQVRVKMLDKTTESLKHTAR